MDSTGASLNSEQYKLFVNKDSNIEDVHVEILPNDDGSYWIPKNQNVRLSADCKDGYQLTTSSNVLNLSDAKEVTLSSEATGKPTIEERFAELESHINDLQQEQDEYKSLGQIYVSRVGISTFDADVNRDITNTVNNLPAGKYVVLYKVYKDTNGSFRFYNYTDNQGYYLGDWSATVPEYSTVITHSGGDYSRTVNWRSFYNSVTAITIEMILIKVGNI